MDDKPSTLNPAMTPDDIAPLIERKKYAKGRAAYFQAVFKAMYDLKGGKDDLVTVRFGVTGTAYAPNYAITRASDGRTFLFWGTSHKPCDADFPDGWSSAHMTEAAFTPADLNKHRSLHG